MIRLHLRGVCVVITGPPMNSLTIENFDLSTRESSVGCRGSIYAKNRTSYPANLTWGFFMSKGHPVVSRKEMMVLSFNEEMLAPVCF